LTNYLHLLKPEQIKSFRKELGSTGTNHVVREFQNAIHQGKDDFEPSGLLDWIKTQSGQFTSPAKNIGDNLQLEIRNYVFKQLKKFYGEKEKAWWTYGVPEAIQIHCSERSIAEKRIEPEENYLDTIHYHEIIKMKEHKQEFIPIFTPPNAEREKEDNKTKWFVKFNSVRIKYSHPERRNVSEEELKFLEELQGWLLPRLNEAK
jgi:hypothetical protein